MPALLTEAEVAAARANLVGGFALRIDSNQKILGQLSLIGFHGLPLDKPGVWLVELDSARFRDARKPGQRPVQARASLVQVTNLNLTVRASARGDSLVWVTAIDTGRKVITVEGEDRATGICYLINYRHDSRTGEAEVPAPRLYRIALDECVQRRLRFHRYSPATLLFFCCHCFP